MPGSAPPDPVLRLFPEGLPGAGPADLIERLLEEGDSADLRWLTAALEEGAPGGAEAVLAAWLEHHGTRRLSDRSRAFWSRLLGVPTAERSPTAHAVWPL